MSSSLERKVVLEYLLHNLWALNKLRNANEHAIVTPVAMAGISIGSSSNFYGRGLILPAPF